MSLTKTQIDALIDRNCKSNDISYPVADKTADENLALDKAFSIIFKSGGRWQFDDSNFTDYPIISRNIVSGQRDYTFTADENGNLILDVYKVMVKTSANGPYVEIQPVDQQSDADMSSFYDGQNTSGIPTRYDKTANGIFLDAIPNYNATDGIKVFINREGSYFSVGDTTKKPGFAGLFHEYIALRPSYQYAYRNSLDNVNKLQEEMLRMEKEMSEYYTFRERDSKRRMVAFRQNNR